MDSIILSYRKAGWFKFLRYTAYLLLGLILSLDPRLKGVRRVTRDLLVLVKCTEKYGVKGIDVLPPLLQSILATFLRFFIDATRICVTDQPLFVSLYDRSIGVEVTIVTTSSNGRSK